MNPPTNQLSQTRQYWVIGTICVACIILALLTIFFRPKPQVTAALTDPDSSCSIGEYAAEKAQRPQNFDNKGYKGPLVVVSGRSPINTTQQVHIGQPVTVCVMGLNRWIYEDKHQPNELRLFIGGAMLANVAPSAVSPPEQEYLKFVPQMETADPADWQAWASIVEAARHSHDYVLPISIARTDTKEIIESEAAASVNPYPPNSLELLGLMFLLLLAIIYLAVDSDLLRNTINGKPALGKPPYSLGLVQMSFWFYLVVTAYAYIAVSMRQIQIPMGSVLGLLGISSTTGLAAVAVDRQKTNSAQGQQNDLLAEQKVLNTEVANLNTKGVAPGSAEAAELTNRNARLVEIQNLLTQLTGVTSAKSNGFLNDILNDGDGMSFHRFQIVVWTIVLGVAFVWSVYRNMTMPEFDASFLTLMGISSGTYIGFKFPEKIKT